MARRQFEDTIFRHSEHAITLFALYISTTRETAEGRKHH